MKVVYYANDGKKFDSREACEAYEKSVDKEKDAFLKIQNEVSEYNKLYGKNVKLTDFGKDYLSNMFDDFFKNI